MKAFEGGNNAEWSQLCESARQVVFNRMNAHSDRVGADVGMCFNTTEIGQGATDVLLNGTAKSQFKKLREPILPN